MVGVVGPRSTAWFFSSPPNRREGLCERPRLAGLLAGAARRGIVIVSAPSGFGKTVAVASWARTLESPVAWLTLTTLDADAARVDSLILDALRGVAPSATAQATSPRPPATPVASPGSAQVLRAVLEDLREPVVLVIDDVDSVGPVLTDTLISTLVSTPSEQITLVLIGTQEPPLALARQRLAGRVATIGGADLRFTVEEIAELARVVGRATDLAEARSLAERTGGWPAAVHLALTQVQHLSSPLGTGREPDAVVELASADDGQALLSALVVEEVFPRLPSTLVDFILDATTCSRLDAVLARAITGRSDSERLLEECVSRGLFLDRYVDADHSVVYRWHDSFATVCRAELARRDPERQRGLNRRAADEVSSRGFPAFGVEYARRAEDFGLAAQIISTHWLAMALHARGAEAARLLSDLPPPWSEDPAIVLAHACCLDLAGERDAARLRYRRARSLIERDGVVDSTIAVSVALATLFVADCADELAAATETVRRAVSQHSLLSEPVTATALFILGWTELRLRRNPVRAVETLTLAAAECQRFGQLEIAARARLNLAFATAFAGDFTRGEEALDAVEASHLVSERAWQSYDGGLQPFVRGFIAFYRGRRQEAREHLETVLDVGGEIGYTPLARVYLLFLAAETRDRDALESAETMLAGIPDEEVHGVPWHAYKAVARATVAEACGNRDRALEELRGIELSPNLPVTVALAARIYERAGDHARALEVLALLPNDVPAYVHANALVCQALIAAAAGRWSQAHSTLELAMDLARLQGVVQPFTYGDPRLVALLHGHGGWGTRHEELVAAVLADAEPVDLPVALSRREREILAYLRTSMTTSEIAGKLFVSVNTVKTHQRSIYRKLGVASRREAVRVRTVHPVPRSQQR